MKLDEKLVQLRKEKRFSQLKVAEELGVSRQAISRWEVGAALPSTENLRRLAELYGVPVDMLLKNESELPAGAEAVVVSPMTENQDKEYWKITIAVSLLLGGLGLGYLFGYLHRGSMEIGVEPIPLSQLDQERWDDECAEEPFTYGWPEYQEGE